MDKFFYRIRKRYLGVLLSLSVWLFITLVPWQGWFSQQLGFRFVISLVIFILPGGLLAYFIDGLHPVNWMRLFLIGLAISVTIAGLLGLIARAMKLSFTFIQIGYCLFGAILVIGFFGFYEKRIARHININSWEAISLVITLAFAVFIAKMSLPRPIHDDGYTYNALVYYYQHAQAITFDFPDPLSRLNISRFWIAFWPLVEAILSNFSKVDGLLITGVYLAPALSVFALLATFVLGRALGLNRQGATLAVVAQGFSLIRLSESSQPGYEFFSQLTEDKAVAAFVICPILFLLVVEYLENPALRRLLLVGLGALAAIFTHPVIFGMACLIIVLYSLVALFQPRGRWAYFKLIGLLVFIVIIPYSFRFGGSTDYQRSLSFTISDVFNNGQVGKLGGLAYNSDSPFYGISLELLRGLPYRISIIASVIALFLVRKNKLGRFTLAAFLVLGFSTLPYTGWLIGLFTTPSLLLRITWLMPFGFAFAFIVQIFEQLFIEKLRILNKFSHLLKPLTYISAKIVLILGLIYILHWATINLGKPDINLRAYYQRYIEMGNAMNNLDVDNQPIIVGGPDETTNAIIPSLTRNLWPLVFRVEIQGQSRDLWESLVGDQIEVHERYSRLIQNHVEYLLVRNLAPWMQELLIAYPANFKMIRWNSYLVLYQLTP